MARPKPQWVVHQGRHIACMAFGSGAPTVLVLDKWFTHLDADWDDPRYSSMLEELAASLTVVRYDRSGMGLADRLLPLPGSELSTWADEAVAVMDSLGVPRFGLLANGWAVSLGIEIAARYPERMDRLALDTVPPKLISSSDYPHGIDPELARAGRDLLVQRCRRRRELPSGCGRVHDSRGTSRSDDCAELRHHPGDQGQSGRGGAAQDEAGGRRSRTSTTASALSTASFRRLGRAVPTRSRRLGGGSSLLPLS